MVINSRSNRFADAARISGSNKGNGVLSRDFFTQLFEDNKTAMHKHFTNNMAAVDKHFTDNKAAFNQLFLLIMLQS